MAVSMAGSEGAPRILFLALVDNVGMERVVGALHAQGAQCALLSPPGFHATKTRAIQRLFSLPRHRGLWLGAVFARPHLERAIRLWRAELIVPLDDMAAKLLRMLADSRAISGRLRLLLKLSFGSSEGYAVACSRADLMTLAAEIGIRIPPSEVVEDVASALSVATRWGYPVILKAEHTSGGFGVQIAETPEALRAAFQALIGDRSLARRVRMMIRHRIWSLAGMPRIAGLSPLLQAVVPGMPAMRSVSSWQGQALEGISFVAERVHPEPTGASTMVRKIDNPEMDEAARRIVGRLGCSGFMSFDFMLDSEGHAHLIEMNPRPIGTTHLGRLFGHDACAPLLARLKNAPWVAPQPDGSEAPELIALFPKEMERNPDDLARLSSIGLRHDVPRDDPELVRPLCAASHRSASKLCHDDRR